MRHFFAIGTFVLASTAWASGGFRCEWTGEIASAKLQSTTEGNYDEHAHVFTYLITFKEGSTARTARACKGTDIHRSRIKIKNEAEFEIEARKQPDLNAGSHIVFDILYSNGVGGNGVVTSETYEFKKLQP